MKFSFANKHVVGLIMTVLVLAVYCYPALRSTAHTGLRNLPPAFAPDQSLYLNISTMKPANAGNYIDPYYGIPVPAVRMGYLKFRFAFLLFGELDKFLQGNLWLALLVWNLFWWALLCVLALWFFREFLPCQSAAMTLFGLFLVMFFNFGILRNVLGAWFALPSLRGFETVELPYIRPFFPQIPVALLVLYLVLQIKALQQRSPALWGLMAVTQFFAFAMFPYAMLMMAVVTGVAIAGQFVSDHQHKQRFTPFIYGVACGLADLTFFFHGSEAARSGAPGQYSIIHLHLSVLPHRMGGAWILLAGLTVAVLFIRNLAPEIKWPLLGMGVSTLFLLLGDAFFSETELQVSQHGAYFVHSTASILFVFLFSAGYRHFDKQKPGLLFGVGAVAVLLLMNGIFVAQGTYAYSLPVNEEQAELAQALQYDSPQKGDLVVARAGFVDDDCAWTPLISDAKVLYCRNAQVLFSPTQNEKIQRFRQAIYLYFTGRDVNWIEHVIEGPSDAMELSRLTFLGQLTTDPADRQKGIDAIRSELVPMLEKAGRKDPEMQSFFSQFHRVIVIDDAARPTFAESRVSQYLKIDGQQDLNHLRILNCTPFAP